MPYGARATGVDEPGAPAQLDFDALYERAIQPAIEARGYMAVRADQEYSPLIVVDMLERLTLSDLVLADLTLHNGNVYYEVGVRHATEKHNCVLIAASWAKPLFDLAQIRQGRYPLPAGKPTAKDYAAVRRAVEAAIEKYAGAPSPVHRVQRSAQLDPSSSTFAKLFEQLAELQGAVRALAHQPSEAKRRATLKKLVAEHAHAGGAVEVSKSAALELLHAVRDHMGWQDALAYIAKLPAAVRELPYVREQHHLAQSKSGDATTAIAGLEALIASHGDTSERRGLLGGTFKRLFDESTHTRQPNARYLDLAIAHYERGMLLDLNQYYPANNLPRLYRERRAPGDVERAAAVSHVVMAACERALQRTAADPWLRPTLLGAAFDAADVSKARELAARVRAEGPARWMQETTISDLERSAQQCADARTRSELLAIIDEMRRLVPESASRSRASARRSKPARQR